MERTDERAMTEYEWETIAADDIEPLGKRLESAAIEATMPFHDISRHALAALALYGQPFGFTHDDVTFLRETATFYRFYRCNGYEDIAKRSDALADRIAALLPPESH